MQRELSDIKRKETYKTIAWKDFNAQDNKVLPLIWTFNYKTNNKGYLRKYKARICVRGDLQATVKDTYAATLATRVFRALIAITTVRKEKWIEWRIEGGELSWLLSKVSSYLYIHKVDKAAAY